MNRRSLYINVFFDIVALFAAFFIMIWIKPATKRVYLPNYIIPFLVFAFVWLAVSLITQKYSAPERTKLSRAVLHIIITNLLIAGIATILMFLFRSDFYSRLVFGGIVALTTLIEIVFAFCDYFVCNANVGPDTSKVFEAYQRVVGRSPEVSVSKPFPPELTLEPVPEDIRNAIIEESNPEVFQFIAENIDLNIPNYSLLSTTTRFNVDKLPEKTYLKIVNLKRINDIRFINKFFESVNRKIPDGGLFIGCVETKDQRKKRILRKFPPVLNRIYYFFDFIIKRVFPKFNLTKRIYFFLTRGENRVVSKAETFGRLYSCGFEIVNEQNILGWLYFIARKKRKPYFDTEPTYGPLVKLHRIGENGKIIHVYKLRTMHPFAEYLQEYVYEKSDLEEGGKFKDDFRVTTLGKFFRKFWLDELPMFINYFRGDLKLVGVRPLSEHYFSLYSKELQEKRIKTRPGLIPPFYVDLPKTIEEIQASELKYLETYEKHPFRTDWKYFWKAFWNILFRKARSA
ncbi:MAG: sugar transferase [Bacteroidales bacterium]|nr:sugar transferase [Bacteroidales bacterium]